jgi:hypothetical protein
MVETEETPGTDQLPAGESLPPSPETENPPPVDQVQEPAAPPKKSDELKIIIIIKDSYFILGVQAPDCDPVSEHFIGELPAAIQRIPDLVARAREQWETSRLYPTAVLPEPPPAQTSPSSPARSPAATKPNIPKAQQPFF